MRTILLATLGFVGTACQSELPASDAEARLRILFESDRDGDYDIYSIDADGSNLVVLTSNDDQDVEPAWSHSRELVAYCSDRDRAAPGMDVWIMDADGQNARAVTRGLNARQPAWAPGDSLLAFVVGSGSDAELALLRLRTGQIQILTHNDATDLDPVWTNDGDLLFCSNRDGDAEIYVMDLSTSTVVQLTANEVPDGEPTISQDGTRIYYVTRASGRPEIVAMNRDGAKVAELIRSGAAHPCAGSRSQTIAFVHDPSSGGQIALMTADGAAVRVLTQGSFRNLSPDW